MAVSAPVLESIEKPDTSFGCDSAAYRWVAVWSTTNPLGEPPVANGVPATGVRAPPVVTMLQPDTLLRAELAAYTYLPAATTNALAFSPDPKGLPIPFTRSPVDAILSA